MLLKRINSLYRILKFPNTCLGSNLLRLDSQNGLPENILVLPVHTFIVPLILQQ